MAALSVLPLAMAATTTASQAAPAAAKSVYLVMTAPAPLASYDGSDPGYSRTKPNGRAKVDVRSANARAYARHLIAGHDAALRSIGADGAKRVDYTVAFNGFSASLTDAEAARIAKAPGVAHVWKDELRYAETTTTPDFLGLTGSTGAWATQFGGASKAGEGVIIGVLDSGIWSDSASFAALPSPRPDQAVIDAKWHGVCDAGETSPVTCNNKLIGARYYTKGNKVESFEFLSPRDYNGHGTHTASTAGGNNGVPATINGGSVGSISGMAPAARLAAYKVLWATPDGRASGTTESIVKAINDAVADGVDVINYSVSGSSQSVVGADEIAFLGAADAGVFVSASAGNSGDTIGVSSVAHNAPWTMTVAASTHDRGVSNTVTLGNGQTYAGVGVSPTGVGPAPLVDSSTVGLPGADPTKVALCYSAANNGGVAVLDPAKIAGKIVICLRGTTARVDKSAAVKEAGGVGMVLANTSAAQSLNADFHAVPTSHVNAVNGAAIRAYAASAGAAATATIGPRDPAPARAPEMAGFSSYGPALAGGGDLLKPDVTAPGVDVIAAVSPAGDAGHNDFNSLSGTSMSAPHVAGLAALLKQAHPQWSPMWIKSALMTTATTLDNRGLPIQRTGHDATPLDYGNGHVVPPKSFDPGLVYSNSAVDWFRYGCGIGQFQQVTTSPAFCQRYGGMDPSDLNYPSIAIAGLAGSQTISRTVTNTSVDQASQYKPTLVLPAGFTGSVNVDKLTVPPLQSRTFKVTITRTTAPLGAWAFGSLTWTDKRGHSVRSSIALNPVAAAAPSEIAVAGASGTSAVTVTPGYTGTLTAAVAGLVPSQVATVTTPKPTNTTASVVVPAGTKVLRFATYDADYPAGTDLDISVTRGGVLVGSSGGGSSEESVTLTGADLGGTYVVTLDYFAGASDTIDIKLNSFAVGSSATGNLTATPATQSVTTGVPALVTLNWTGLTPGVRHLGTVTWSDGSATVGRTLVSVLP